MPELLAPAGSWECLRAAIQAGADAVYFGVDQLNMRAKGSINFSMDELPAIAEACHTSGVRAYLALNTIMYDHDLSLAKRLVIAAKESGIDAVIASDQAVLLYAKEAGIPLHISTQLNVTNIDTVRFYALFADTMVLSRELALEQVSEMARKIEKENICGPSGKPVRLEIFAHGALCMAVSGKCYISLHTNFASANRGACVQNCRRKYTVRDSESGFEFEMENDYIMSAKDLCTIGFLDKVVASGAAILKIEGRGRSEEYVFTVTQCYREALQALSDGTYSPEKVRTWETRLSTVFNRGFWDGYYLGRKTGEWHDTDGSVATKKKVFVGKARHYYPHPQVAEIQMEAGTLSVGDEIMISGPTTGVMYSTIGEIRVNQKSSATAQKGELITIPLPDKVRASDKVYKITSR